MVTVSASSPLFMVKSPLIQAAQQQNTVLSSGNEELTEEEQKQVEELKARDQEVRTHENAHKTAGGSVVGNISYQTLTGPDGREYAIGGEAQIDASSVSNNPRATIQKMDMVVRAALAPAEPSSQDYAVARAAQAARLNAQRELRELEEAQNNGKQSRVPGILSDDRAKYAQAAKNLSWASAL